MFREFIYRIGRRLYLYARRDIANIPEKNGEYWLLKKVINLISKPSILLDIGSNKGDWTGKALEYSLKNSNEINIHAFEPSSFTRDLLSSRFAENKNIKVLDFALSNEEGVSEFYIGSEGGGTNSLHKISGQQVESVKISTLDSYLKENYIHQVSFAKIDTEGFDALVLDGGKQSLIDGRFDLLQFEYNWRWLLNSKSLRNVFDLIENTPYSLGQLSNNKILIFDKWHFEIDRFFENNYLLIKKSGPFYSLGIPATYDESNTLRY